MPAGKVNRRSFLRKSAGMAAAGLSLPASIGSAPAESRIIGHGEFRYRVRRTWGDLDPSRNPVKNCHEMVMDSRGRLFMVGDETRNNILVYDKSGKLLDSWGSDFPGGHGLSLWDANGEEFLLISDFERDEVYKTTLEGRILMTIRHPSSVGAYAAEYAFKPTETAVGPSGEIYVADGYGSQWILHYSQEGEFIRKFGGRGDEDHQFQTAHGVCLDARDPLGPTLLCTSRGHNSFKRFTLEGEYLSTIFLPGAYVCRAVIDGENIYSGVCWSRLRYLNQTPRSGFVTILNADDEVVSNPGGTAPRYENGELQLMVQDQPIFRHCHDVCVDEDKNLYICQWNAEQSYPIKLERV